MYMVALQVLVLNASSVPGTCLDSSTNIHIPVRVLVLVLLEILVTHDVILVPGTRTRTHFKY